MTLQEHIANCDQLVRKAEDALIHWTAVRNTPDAEAQSRKVHALAINAIAAIQKVAVEVRTVYRNRVVAQLKGLFRDEERDADLNARLIWIQVHLCLPPTLTKPQDAANLADYLNAVIEVIEHEATL